MICKCGRAYRNWTSKPKAIVCKCGETLELLPDDGQTTHEEPDRPQDPICQHRGPSAGKASCGCGQIFHCSFTGGYCGDRDVVEFATIGADVLTGQNYRRCSGCSEFSTSTEQTHASS